MIADNQQEQPSFPARFSKVLFERYPHLIDYIVKPDCRWQAPDDFAIEVPSRFTPYCPLRIETMANEIIISWAGWHVHCDDWADEYTEDEFIAEALAIIENILSENIVIVIDWINGPGGTGGTCESADIDNQLQNGWPAIFMKDKQFVVISWNGTYDRGSFDPLKCK